MGNRSETWKRNLEVDYVLAAGWATMTEARGGTRKRNANFRGGEDLKRNRGLALSHFLPTAAHRR